MENKTAIINHILIVLQTSMEKELIITGPFGYEYIDGLGDVITAVRSELEKVL